MTHIWNSYEDMVLAQSKQEVWNSIDKLTITSNFNFVCPPNLTELICWSVRLKTLPSLPNTLIGLFCGGNELIGLPNLPPKLHDLYCEHNYKLKAIPPLPESLKELHCSNCTSLKVLPRLPNGLQELYCSDCDINKISILPPNLKKFHCQRNNLTRLPSLPNTLELLYCNQNKLVFLPKLPAKLNTLCSHDNPFELWYCFKELLDDIYLDPKILSKCNLKINKMKMLVLNKNMLCEPQIKYYHKWYQKITNEIIKLTTKPYHIVIEI